jgi:hypothetical protein
MVHNDTVNLLTNYRHAMLLGSHLCSLLSQQMTFLGTRKDHPLSPAILAFQDFLIHPLQLKKGIFFEICSQTVLQIRDVYSGSGFFSHLGSRIQQQLKEQVQNLSVK